MFKYEGWLRVLALIIPYFIIVGVFQIIGYYFVGLDLLAEVKTTADHTIISFFGLLGTLLVIWIFNTFWDKERFIDLGFQTKNRSKEFWIGIGLGAIIMGVSYSLLQVKGDVVIKSVNFNIEETLLSVMLFVIVSVTEEVLLRGYVLKNLMVSFNKYIALLVSSLVFSLMHAANPNIDMLSFVNLFLAGILLGLSYVYTRNLWFPIALHLSWNLFQSLVGFNVSGQDIYSIVEFKLVDNSIINGGDFGFEGSILCVLTQLIAIAFIHKYFKGQSVANRPNVALSDEII